jgi:hypothetical protein
MHRWDSEYLPNGIHVSAVHIINKPNVLCKTISILIYLSERRIIPDLQEIFILLVKRTDTKSVLFMAGKYLSTNYR